MIFEGSIATEDLQMLAEKNRQKMQKLKCASCTIAEKNEHGARFSLKGNKKF